MGGKLGQMLVKTGIVTVGQIGVALDRQRVSRQPLSDVLVDLGFMSPVALAKALSRIA